MKRLFFVRHGQTHMNVSETFSGQIETLLTKEGQQQATQTGKRVKTTLPPIDVIICSPYKRTRHTAELIAKQLDYPIDKIETNPLFIERNFGILEGESAKDFLATHQYHELEKVAGVETLAQLHERAEQALEYLKSRPEDNILVVSHGSFGRALRRVVNQLPYTHELIKRTTIENAEIIELI
jgi:broad specificity phosphatase PhoE